MQRSPRVGVGVIVIKEVKVLLGKRKNSHGHGSWSFCGGHLEFGEGIEECARREAFEEAGISIKNLRLGQPQMTYLKKKGSIFSPSLFLQTMMAAKPG